MLTAAESKKSQKKVKKKRKRKKLRQRKKAERPDLSQPQINYNNIHSVDERKKQCTETSYRKFFYSLPYVYTFKPAYALQLAAVGRIPKTGLEAPSEALRDFIRFFPKKFPPAEGGRFGGERK